MMYRVAAVQIDTGNSFERNLEKIDSFARDAASHGAALIAFPERSDYNGRGMQKHADPVPGPLSEHLSQLARELEVYLLCGVGETHPEGTPWNTVLFFGPDGKILSRYRKLHMFQVDNAGGLSLDESKFTTAGQEIVTTETPLGHLGMSICYDLRFPELYRAMAVRGAEVLFVPSGFTYNTGKDHWELLLRARAVENTCYVVAPNQCGEKSRFRAYGHSIIIDPWGQVIARAGEEEEIIYGDIDSDILESVRQKMPSLKNIRTDIFQI